MTTTRRRRWPLWIVFILLVLPVLELIVLVAIGRWIGWWPTVGAIILLAVAGGLLVRHEGRRTWQSLVAAVQGVEVADGVTVQEAPKAPTRELSDGALVLIGALLLVLPGFLTDVVALIFLLPFTRPLPRRLFADWARSRSERVMNSARGSVPGVVILDADGRPRSPRGDRSSRRPASGRPTGDPIQPSRVIEPPRPSDD